MACMQDPFQAQSSPVRSPHQELKREAHVLAEDLISYRIGKRSLPPSRASATLRRLSDELEERHAVLLNTMCSRLNINHNTARIRFVQVADEVFQEGINWGRIVALFTFGGRLAQFCMRNGMASNVEDVTTWVGDYVAGKADWISRQGGWVSGINQRPSRNTIVIATFLARAFGYVSQLPRRRKIFARN